MGLEEFRDILSVLFPLQQMNSSSNLNYERFKIPRILDSLGHCEFDYKHRKVYVCPPLLVGLPTYGLPRAILTGARSPKLLDELRKATINAGKQARLISQQQKDPLVPQAVIIESSNVQIIAEIAVRVNIAYEPDPAAWRLINYAAGIQEIKTPFEEKKELNWPQRIFSSELLRFVCRQESKAGAKLVEYTNPVNRQRVHWLWEGSIATKVDRDWGRYMSLASNGISVLMHEKQRNRLYVPEYVPLPTYYARALTLCSGLEPSSKVINGQKFGFSKRLPMLVYSEVPSQIADVVGQKLSQPLIQIKLVNKTGELE